MAPPGKKKIPLFAISIVLYLIVIVGLVVLILYVRKKFDKLGVSDLGRWSISTHTDKPGSNELQVCYDGKVQLSLKKQIEPKNPGKVGSNLYVNNMYTDNFGANVITSLTGKVGVGGVSIQGAKPGQSNWGAVPCGTFF